MAQWRDLNFLQLDEDGSHSDHSPHSVQPPATLNKKDQTILDPLHTDKTKSDRPGDDDSIMIHVSRMYVSRMHVSMMHIYL